MPQTARRVPEQLPRVETLSGRVGVTTAGMYLIPCDTQRGALVVRNPEALAAVRSEAQSEPVAAMTGLVAVDHVAFLGSRAPGVTVHSAKLLERAPARCGIAAGGDGPGSVTPAARQGDRRGTAVTVGCTASRVDIRAPSVKRDDAIRSISAAAARRRPAVRRRACRSRCRPSRRGR